MDPTLKNVLFFAAKVLMIDSLALAFLVDSVMVYDSLVTEECHMHGFFNYKIILYCIKG